MMIWGGTPAFHERDLNAGCRRVKVGNFFVDLNVGEQEPTESEVSAFLNPPPGPSEMERLVDRIKNDPDALAALKAATK